VTVVAFISDRGDRYLPECLGSFCKHAPRVASTRVIDDSDHQLGMAGAVQAAWQWALEEDADFLFHVEEDFRFDAHLPLYKMAAILNAQPHLAQLVLKRQPWSDAEKVAGGQIETNPDAYTQREDAWSGLEWVEHETLFSLNPCLIPARTLRLKWASGGLGAERAITDACLAAGMRFGYYGNRYDPPRCEHVGHQRSAGHRW